MSGLHIDPTAKIAASARLDVKRGLVGAGVVIAEGCTILAEELHLAENVQIGAGVNVRSRRFALGAATRVERECRFAGIGKLAEDISLGDECFVGESSAILLPRLVVGDYVAFHHHLLANGYDTCAVGHNCWIGQNSVLNATAKLVIGNNVGIGAYSSIYTHAFNGELLEGCEVFNVGPVTIEDNVWIVGSYNVISPGVTLGRKSMVLTSSVVSRSVAPMHCVGGVPAKDLTDRIKPFRNVTLPEKMAMMRRFIGELASERYEDDSRAIEHGFVLGEKRGTPYRVVCVDDASSVAGHEYPTIIFAMVGTRSDASVFNLQTKRYTKRRSSAEIEVIRFMNGYRARFVPEDRPVVQ
jgi:acetyltransferase-like isoleucine patch superfamily enzyme